jgi:molybdopterin converting factor small subunit
MGIRVEFFGIPRSRCGQATFQIETSGPICLGSVLQILGEKFPRFAADCLHEGSLQSGYVANIAGEQFIDDPQTLLENGVSLLILSSDAGG